MKAVSRKHNLQRQRGIFRQLTIFAIFLLFCTIPLMVSKGNLLWAADEKNAYPDKAGREAFRLWAEREKDRAIAEAARRYWDYWLSKPSRHYSAYRQWMELDQTQKWLQDPKHNPPPLPPPPPLYPPYPYPYSYYYTAPYWGFPPFWPPSPYYFYPPTLGEPRKEGK